MNVKNTTLHIKNTEYSVQNTELKKGDIVEVMCYGGGVLERQVWDLTGNVAFLCTSKVWDSLTIGREAPLPIGFPVSDIKRVVRSNGMR